MEFCDLLQMMEHKRRIPAKWRDIVLLLRGSTYNGQCAMDSTLSPKMFKRHMESRIPVGHAGWDWAITTAAAVKRGAKRRK